MARYYLVVIIINVVITALLYSRRRNLNLPFGALAAAAGFSLSIGLVFPLLAGYLDLWPIVALMTAGGCGVVYCIVRFWGSKPVDESVLPMDFDQQLEEPKEAGESGELVAEEVETNAGAPELSPEDQQEEKQVDQTEVQKEQRLELYEVAASGESDEIQGDGLMESQDIRAEDELDLRDSYITRGFDAKADGKLDLAVKYFSSAMELNPPQDLEAMLVFDICSMLRELGQYRRAGEVLEQFARDRGGQLLPAMAEEVQFQRKYTQFLMEMLEKANTPSLPFSRVPALIKVSVEEKVNQWKNEAL